MKHSASFWFTYYCLWYRQKCWSFKKLFLPLQIILLLRRRRQVFSYFTTKTIYDSKILCNIRLPFFIFREKEWRLKKNSSLPFQRILRRRSNRRQVSLLITEKQIDLNLISERHFFFLLIIVGATLQSKKPMIEGGYMDLRSGLVL